MSRSLLLLTAVTAASQLGVKVVFFTHTHIQQLPTFLQKRAPVLDPESLKVLTSFLARIHILQLLSCNVFQFIVFDYVLWFSLKVFCLHFKPA